MLKCQVGLKPTKILFVFHLSCEVQGWCDFKMDGAMRDGKEMKGNQKKNQFGVE